MSGKVASGFALAGGVAPDPGRPGPAIDPDRREAHLLGRHMVVEQALRHVQDLVARQPDVLEGDLEVVRVGLVATRSLGGHDPVEVGLESRRRSREQVVVAVGDDPQTEAVVEPPQRIGNRGTPASSRTESEKAATSAMSGATA